MQHTRQVERQEASSTRAKGSNDETPFSNTASPGEPAPSPIRAITLHALVRLWSCMRSNSTPSSSPKHFTGKTQRLQAACNLRYASEENLSSPFHEEIHRALAKQLSTTVVDASCSIVKAKATSTPGATLSSKGTHELARPTWPTWPGVHVPCKLDSS